MAKVEWTGPERRCGNSDAAVSLTAVPGMLKVPYGYASRRGAPLYSKRSTQATPLAAANAAPAPSTAHQKGRIGVAYKCALASQQSLARIGPRPQHVGSTGAAYDASRPCVYRYHQARD